MKKCGTCKHRGVSPDQYPCKYCGSIEGFPKWEPILKPSAEFRDMALRDWFAGMCLMGYTANPDTCANMSNEMTAEMSYKSADAMMKAREQK